MSAGRGDWRSCGCEVCERLRTVERSVYEALRSAGTGHDAAYEAASALAGVVAEVGVSVTLRPQGEVAPVLIARASGMVH